MCNGRGDMIDLPPNLHGPEDSWMWGPPRGNRIGGKLTGRDRHHIVPALAMCLDGGPREGQPQSKGGTLRWYEQQNADLQREQDRWDGDGWWRCEALRQLRYNGPRAWFRWVFTNLARHEPSCRWRRFMRRVTLGATP